MSEANAKTRRRRRLDRRMGICSSWDPHFCLLSEHRLLVTDQRIASNHTLMTLVRQGWPMLLWLFRDDPNLFARPPRSTHNDAMSDVPLCPVLKQR